MTLCSKKKVYILNGPPRCGKDTAAEYLVLEHGYTKLEMKGALRKLAISLAALHDFDQIDNADGNLVQAAKLNQVRANTLCFEAEYVWDKDKDRSSVFGFDADTGMYRTWREFLIHISEDICKPIFGEDIFALAALKAIKDCPSNKIVFSDGGFQAEIDAMERERNLDVQLIHMIRDGCTFANDSRRYTLSHNDHISMYNDGTIQQLFNCLDSIIQPD